MLRTADQLTLYQLTEPQWKKTEIGGPPLPEATFMHRHFPLSLGRESGNLRAASTHSQLRYGRVGVDISNFSRALLVVDV